MASNPGDFGLELDKRLTVRIPVKAGPHSIAAAVLLRSHAEADALIKPFMRTTIDGLDITGDPSVDRISVEGPFEATGVGNTPSRNKIYVCKPANGQDELPCARKIISALLRHAWRRPLTDSDLETPLSFYQKQRNEKGTFDAGIESALQFILASPEFLFRFEGDPRDVPAGAVYQIGDVALASRLSFFLWSSAPDDELLRVASEGKLHEHAVLEQQVRRMLIDPRADALIENFAAQWLFLRNLKNFAPDLQIFPDFDDNLRQAMEEETRLFFQSIIREDRNVMELLTANYTFVNERLARHYGIPNIYGSQFRRVTVDSPERRGLLGQASILTVTSYPNRTSPVQRGKWVLTNLLGIPPTPPPPNVPQLKETGDGAAAFAAGAHGTASERCGLRRLPQGDGPDRLRAGEFRRGRPLARRGRWRDDRCLRHLLQWDQDQTGRCDLGKMLSSQPGSLRRCDDRKAADIRAGPGRGVLRYAGCARDRNRDAGANDYRFSALVAGIVESTPFEMKVKKARRAAISQRARSLKNEFLSSRSTLQRRMFLRGLGTAISLPLLDSMVPAQTPLAKTAGQADAPARALLHSARRRDGQLDAGRRGRRFQDVANSRAAGALPNQVT